MAPTPYLKAHVEGVGFDGITAVYALTVRQGASKTGTQIATIQFRRDGTDNQPFQSLVENALDGLGFVRSGQFVPHAGSWECWCRLLPAGWTDR